MDKFGISDISQNFDSSRNMGGKKRNRYIEFIHHAHYLKKRRLDVKTKPTCGGCAANDAPSLCKYEIQPWSETNFKIYMEKLELQKIELEGNK